MKINRDRVQGASGQVQMPQPSNLPQPGSPKRSKGPMIALIIGLIVVLLVAAIGVKFVLTVKQAKQASNENNPPKVVEQPIEQNPSSEVNVEPTVVPSAPNEVPATEPVQGTTFDYENKLIGLKFNYPTEMYMKENTEEVFNVLKGVSGEDGNFDIEEDKLTQMVNLMKLTTGNSDGLFITVSIIPFSMSSEVKSADKTVKVETIIDDNMLKTYDKQLKDALTANGCKIDIFEPSYIREVNGRKAIISERKYSGGKDTQTTTGVVDVIQGLVPAGVNAILVTAITDGNPIEIDKVALFDKIINSLTIILDGQE